MSEFETRLPNPQTLGEVGIHLQYIGKELSKINEKIDNIGKTFVSQDEYDERKKETDRIHEDQEKRFRSLETDRENLKGKWAILAVVAMFVIGLIGSLASQLLSKLVH